MSSNNNNSATMETEQKTHMILKNIEEGANYTASKCGGSIYKVLEEVRELKKSAYSPQLVSIGPLHSNDEHILNSPMQAVKKSYVSALLTRIEERSIVQREKLQVLTECVKEMNKRNDNAKNRYAEEVKASDEDMLEMLVIDGCFILELLYRHSLLKESNPRKAKSATGAESSQSNKPDPIFDIPQTMVTVRNDLLLLENQLPFFVLEKLFILTVLNIWDRPLNRSLIWYVLLFFGNIWDFESKGQATSEVSNGEVDYGYHHILHILHHHHCRQTELDCASEEESSSSVMPCASELEYAGVQFVPDAHQNPLMAHFHNPRGPFKWFHRAQFKIPQLRINDSTETVMRNLIAFEQTCPNVGYYVTSYAFLMDQLINSPKDVEVLENAEVIRSTLGAKEDASDLFNKLCKEIDLPRRDFYFVKICDKAAEYSKLNWPRFMASVRRTYFATPLAFIAFCVGFIYFVIKVVEFVYSFL